jgi:hypothetical protein
VALPKKPTIHAQSLSDYISLFFGQPGVGKTTFVNDFGRVLFISTDRGTRYLSAMREEVSNWVDCQRVLKSLQALKSPPYDFVAIDHVDDWANMGESHVLKKLRVEALTDAGYGKGWSMYKKLLHTFVQGIIGLKMGIVFIAHEETKAIKVDGLEIDRCMPKMSKQAWNIIIPLADVVGFCDIKPMKVKGKRQQVRTIETEPKRDLYAKDRSRRKRPARGFDLLDGRKFIETFGATNNGTEENEKAKQQKGRRARKKGVRAGRRSVR